MSPEQAMAEPTVDHRADIYALGAVAYEMLTGHPPFRGSTAQAILAAHVTETAQPVTGARSAVSPLLNSVVMRCLEKNPADRWQTADELIPLLEQAATPSGGMTPTNTRPISGVKKPVKRRIPAWAYAIPAAIILAVAGWFGRGLFGGGDGTIHSIAVLPIEDISGSDATFVEAMHEALISAIGQTSITVVSRSAVQRYRQTTQSIREIASALNVDAVLEGSIFREGQRVRLSVQMVEPETARHLWQQNYERDMTSSTQMKVQDDVVKEIATELSASIEKARQPKR
jgi:serine/threonine-protein kinase